MADALDLPAFARVVEGARVIIVKTLDRSPAPPAGLVEVWPRLAGAVPLALVESAGAIVAHTAPGVWLAWGEVGPLDAARAALGPTAYAFDLSPARVVLALEGPAAWRALRANSPLFLHDDLAMGTCAATRLGDADILLARPRSGPEIATPEIVSPEIMLIIETTLAAYVAALLSQPA